MIFRSFFLTAVALICFVFTAGCASKQISDSSSKTENYNRSVALSEEAFKELDREVSGSEAPVKKESQVKEEQSVVNKADNKAHIQEEVITEKSSPASVGEKKRPNSNTKYPIENGYPVWVLNPYADGYSIVAVGSAKNNGSGISAMKRTARLNGMSEISRIIKLQIDNEISTLTVVDNSGNVVKDVDTYSRQKSDSLLKSVKEIDSWTDPATGDYYLFLGIEGE
ncbi:MAG: LPP20 family lipoprotein [Deferribacterales bacterium]|nr:LPP20 family lipoprotein [Deferribacterales bacterium]